MTKSPEFPLFVVPALAGYVFSGVGTARCAVRAASSGATSAAARPYCDIRSARCTRAGTSQRDVPTTLNAYTSSEVRGHGAEPLAVAPKGQQQTSLGQRPRNIATQHKP